jgi:hypothetical protein
MVERTGDDLSDLSTIQPSAPSVIATFAALDGADCVDVLDFGAALTAGTGLGSLMRLWSTFY